VLTRSLVRLPAGTVLSNNPGEVAHTRVPLSPSCMIWYQPIVVKVTAVYGRGLIYCS